MNVNSVGSSIAKLDLAGGDDPAAWLNAVEGVRADGITQAATDAQRSLAAKMHRLQAIIDAHFAARLSAMPDAPGGTDKILGDLSTGQDIRSGSPEMGGDLPADAASVGLDLPTQTWLEVTIETRDANGNVVSSQPAVLDSPQQVADIRAKYKQSSSGDIDEYIQSQSGSGSKATTTYIQVHNTEGQVRASDADIAQFEANVSGTITQLRTDIAADQQKLIAILRGMTASVRDNKSVAEPAKQDLARAQERHFEELLQSLGDPQAAAAA